MSQRLQNWTNLIPFFLMGAVGGAVAAKATPVHPLLMAGSTAVLTALVGFVVMLPKNLILRAVLSCVVVPLGGALNALGWSVVFLQPHEYGIAMVFGLFFSVPFILPIAFVACVKDDRFRAGSMLAEAHATTRYRNAALATTLAFCGLTILMPKFLFPPALLLALVAATAVPLVVTVIVGLRLYILRQLPMDMYPTGPTGGAKTIDLGLGDDTYYLHRRGTTPFRSSDEVSQVVIGDLDGGWKALRSMARHQLGVLLIAIAAVGMALHFSHQLLG